MECVTVSFLLCFVQHLSSCAHLDFSSELSFTLYIGNWYFRFIPDYGCVPTVAFLCSLGFIILLVHVLLVITVIFITFYCNQFWIVLLWWFHLSNCIIITVFITVFAHVIFIIITFIVDIGIRGWVVYCCKYRCFSSVIVTQSCGMYDTTVSSNGISDVVVMIWLSLHNIYRSWYILLQYHTC